MISGVFQSCKDGSILRLSIRLRLASRVLLAATDDLETLPEINFFTLTITMGLQQKESKHFYKSLHIYVYIIHSRQQYYSAHALRFGLKHTNNEASIRC